MSIKEYLLQALALDKQIKAKQDQIRRLRDMQESISGTIAPDKVQTSRKNDRMGDITAHLLDLIDEYAKDVTRLLKIKYDIKILIDSVENADYRTVLEWRYVNYMKWDEIAEQMNYNERWVHRLHDRALKAVEERQGNMVYQELVKKSISIHKVVAK